MSILTEKDVEDIIRDLVYKFWSYKALGGRESVDHKEISLYEFMNWLNSRR